VQVRKAREKPWNNMHIFILNHDLGRSRTSSDKNLQIVEGGQYLVEVEQTLTKIFKLLKAVSI
jgi:hypothetical protein